MKDIPILLVNQTGTQGTPGGIGMLMKTILNRIEKHKGFVYGKARWSKDGREIEIPISPRKNGKAICSGCRKPAPGYDHLGERRFTYVPLWGIPVIFLYVMRRVACSTCGVTVEAVPWATGKSPLTRSFALFLATWAKRLSWSEVGSIFGTTWNRVYDAVKWVVEYGLERRDISDVTAIGVDEIQYSRGHKYLTLVYQLNEGARRLLYVGKDRTVKTLLRFFHDCGRSWCQQLQFVCSDMWKPYVKVIAKKAPRALHILDRFHIVANLGKALNKIRAGEARQMKREGYEEHLKHTKYCFLKNPENLTPTQKLKLKDVLQYDLKSVRAYLLKESFQLFWNYTSPYWARWYLQKWCARAMRSRLDPIKSFVRTVRRHEDLILNWFKAKKEFSCGVVEGLNRKVNLITRKAYGHRSVEVLTIALFHALGGLPEPEMTHRFC
jgi:transposase